MLVEGIIIGAGTFLIIGLLHPVVIKGEYHFGKGIWPIFLAAGAAAIVLSPFAGNIIVSALLAVLGFSLLWSIGELFHQEQRVRKGWYPANPRRMAAQAQQAEDELGAPPRAERDLLGPEPP